MQSGESRILTQLRKANELLIVEDDREFIQDLLASWSPPSQVSIASSGEEAFKYLQSFVPALVILDLSLPCYLAETDAMEGCEILSYVRRHITKQLPVIVISRDTTPETRAYVTSLGANEFIGKPFNVVDLERAVSRLIGQGDKVGKPGIQEEGS